MSKSDACCFLTESLLGIEAAALSLSLRFYRLVLASQKSHRMVTYIPILGAVPCINTQQFNNVIVLCGDSSILNLRCHRSTQCYRLCMGVMDWAWFAFALPWCQYVLVRLVMVLFWFLAWFQWAFACMFSFFWFWYPYFTCLRTSSMCDFLISFSYTIVSLMRACRHDWGMSCRENTKKSCSVKSLDTEPHCVAYTW